MKKAAFTLASILTAGLAFASDANRFVLQERAETGLGYPYDVSVASADLDNDGDLDLILASPPGVQLYKGTNSGYSNQGFIFSTSGENPDARVAVALADMDNDGREDVVLASPSGVRWLRNKGAMRFEDKGFVINAGNTYLVGVGLEVKDLNRDGRKDIIYAVTDRIEVYYQE
ncbi:MAG: VCBS repeat-containing protein [Nanoarchaeota archaeon]|nr:VCBS repeat-containing protein [Nanoarchaeota archaeon]